MKKALLLISVMLVLLAPLAAQSVTVTSPNGGESWALKSPHNITWISANAGTVKVDIILRRTNNTKVGVIKSQVALSAGAWPWTSVGTLEDGTVVEPRTDYIVRIRDAGGTFSDDSNAAFVIATAPTLQLLSPNGGETWAAGTQQNITWKAEDWGGQVQLNLFKDGKFVGTIDGGVGSTLGSFTWTVGRLLDGKTSGFGGGFKVRAVRVYKGLNVPTVTLMDESDGGFHIRVGQEVVSSQKPIVHTIKVIEPLKDAVFYYGNYGRPRADGVELGPIWWETGCYGPFKIILCDGFGNVMRELKEVSHQPIIYRFYHHIRPADTPVGDYKLQIKSTDGQCLGLSAKFRVQEMTYNGAHMPDLRVCKQEPRIVKTPGKMIARLIIWNAGWADSQMFSIRYAFTNGKSGEKSIASLKSGSAVGIDVDCDVTGSGPWPYTITVDCYNVVDELNENDNVLTGTIPNHEPDEGIKCSGVSISY